ncbi:MAG TPA: sulfite exporter TauE/SafE family protein [Solirubrobacterales bacterium]|nr:sulfite exporter TauE/SafE family protein [Solirubrobacterales bacterium]
MDPIIVVFGFGIGLLVGMTGMGGGSLMTPLLILVFGIQPVTAVGTDIFYGAVTKTVGGWRHLKHKTVHRGIAFWLAVGSVPMAIAGVWLIEVLQRNYGEDEVNKVVLGMVASALLVVGVATLIRALFLRDVIPERSAMHLYRRHIVAAIVTGAVTGFVIGLTSAGSGTLIALVLIAVFRLTPQRVVGTDVFHAAVLLWAAGVAHWIGGNVDMGLALNILVGSIPGVLIGSQLAVRVPTGLLRNALGLVLVASSITLITKEHVPHSVLIPSLSVAGLAIAGLFAVQIGLHRQRQREPRGPRQAPAAAG